MRDPFEVVQHFGGLSPGEEVYGEEVTDLSQWLRERLRAAVPSPSPAVSTLLVVGASQNDDGLVRNLASRLQSDQIIVKAVFAGEALPSEFDGSSTAVALVPWGNADRVAVD
ncbi:hypothetical protein, partial [Salmonella enterica]|uniref:hypothetical protein n=1 Tax=Salmonella enterica TaxID=28901 RepID=UPI0012FD0E50